MSDTNSAHVSFSSCKVKELRRDATLPAKFERQLAGYPLQEMFEGKQVAIKMHVGSDIGFTTIHPIFVRIVVQAVKKAGGHPLSHGRQRFTAQRGRSRLHRRGDGCPVH